MSSFLTVRNIWTHYTAGFHHVENMLFRETDWRSAMPTWQTHLIFCIFLHKLKPLWDHTISLDKWGGPFNLRAVASYSDDKKQHYIIDKNAPQSRANDVWAPLAVVDGLNGHVCLRSQGGGTWRLPGESWGRLSLPYVCWGRVADIFWIFFNWFVGSLRDCSRSCCSILENTQLGDFRLVCFVCSPSVWTFRCWRLRVGTRAWKSSFGNFLLFGNCVVELPLGIHFAFKLHSRTSRWDLWLWAFAMKSFVRTCNLSLKSFHP